MWQYGNIATLDLLCPILYTVYEEQINKGDSVRPPEYATAKSFNGLEAEDRLNNI
jgi:hypothetical protein